MLPPPRPPVKPNPGNRRPAPVTRLRGRVLRVFARIERTCAWGLLAAGVVVFVGVLIGWITVGDFRWPTLLLSASLVVDGFSAVQEAEEDEPEPR